MKKCLHINELRITGSRVKCLECGETKTARQILESVMDNCRVFTPTELKGRCKRLGHFKNASR